MPRAPAGEQPPSALGRNQACHQCRRRKLKCDTKVPCGACTKSHAHARRQFPKSTPPLPECTYDNMDDIADNFKGKISRLEAEIAELRAVLREKDLAMAGCICGAAAKAFLTQSPQHDVSQVHMLNSNTAANESQISNQDRAEPHQTSISELESNSLQPGFLTYLDGDVALTEPSFIPTMSILEASDSSRGFWPGFLPPRELMQHLVETVFNSHPLATRLFHRPTFMESLQKSPNHPDFPHISVLHAICALASLYTPVVTDIHPVNLDAGQNAAAAVASAFIDRGALGSIGEGSNCKHPNDFRARDMSNLELFPELKQFDFATVHLQWSGHHMRLALRRGEKLLQQLQAAILGALFFHSRGNFIGAIAWAGHSSRVLAGFGLHTSPGFAPLSRIPQHLLFVLRPPETNTEEELGRNIFWIAYATERIINASNPWPMILEDEDCSQMMPCRGADFTAGAHVPTRNRQRLLSQNMLITHPPQATDPFILYIKASVLIGKVKSFNGRFKYRYTDGIGVGFGTPVSPQADEEAAFVNEVTTINPRTTGEFKSLDSLIGAFIQSFPRAFKDPIGLNTGTKVDATLYMAHLLPHVAMIALHDPHANIFAERDSSAVKLLHAARAILDLIYKICSTSFDLIYLDHMASTAWFIAGVTLIRFLSVRTLLGDEVEAQRLTQELGAVRFILGSIGDRTGVGSRQARLLERVYKMEMGVYALLTANEGPSTTSGSISSDNQATEAELQA